MSNEQCQRGTLLLLGETTTGGRMERIIKRLQLIDAMQRARIHVLIFNSFAFRTAWYFEDF
ncbi:hypothetical protein BVY11_17115 [Pseudomonas amygdali pv. morsprunorum]|nr:hypothetical protein BVY11_17115 [Pseudomonas amygdali pv. morsprunorum]PPS31475.1 hypothetical protein BVY12_20190 [Pseudomonas amygdali pv. morsprunorum]